MTSSKSSLNICQQCNKYYMKHSHYFLINSHPMVWHSCGVKLQLLTAFFILCITSVGYCFDENVIYALDEYSDAVDHQVSIKRQVTSIIDVCDKYGHGRIKGYRLTPTSRFILFDDNQNWDKARETCESKKMQFATIRDNNVNYHIYQSLKTLNKKHFGGNLAGVWIGGHDRDIPGGGANTGEGFFRWVNPLNKTEEPLEYESFELGNPNNFGTLSHGIRTQYTEEDCVEVYVRNYKRNEELENLFWNDRGCHGSTRFLCEYQPNLPDQCYEKSDAKSTPPPESDQNGINEKEDQETAGLPRRIGHSKFHFIGKQSNWQGAQEACNRHGLMGAVITDKSSQELLEYAVTMMMMNKRYPKYLHNGRRLWISGIFMDRQLQNKSFAGEPNQFKGYDGKLIWTATNSIVGEWRNWYENKAFYKDGNPEPRDDSYSGLENCLDVHIIRKAGVSKLAWYATACQLPGSVLCMDVDSCVMNNKTLIKRQIQTNYMEYGFLLNGKQFHAMGDPNRKQTWIEAHVNCKNLGLQLTAPADFIQSRILVEKLGKKIHHGTLGYFWLGYFGGPSSEFTHLGTNDLGCLSWKVGKVPWEKDQPNITSNGELLCVKMDFRRRGRNGFWSIGNCFNEKNFYLCEEKCSNTEENESPNETKRSILKFKNDVLGIHA